MEWERKFSSKLFLRFGFNLKGFEDELEELGFAGSGESMAGSSRVAVSASKLHPESLEFYEKASS